MRLVILSSFVCMLNVIGASITAHAEDKNTAASVAASEEAEPAPATWSLGFGVGSGAITGTDNEAFSQGVSSSLQLGYRLNHKLRLQLNGDYTSFTRFQLDPTKSQQQSALTLGLRWAPFEPVSRPNRPHIDLSSIYLKGGLGVGRLVRTPYDTFNPFRDDQVKWGGAVTAGLGWAPIRGPGYSFGIEASDSVVIYKDEVRHNFGVNLMANIDLF